MLRVTPKQNESAKHVIELSIKRIEEKHSRITNAIEEGVPAETVLPRLKSSDDEKIRLVGMEGKMEDGKNSHEN